MRATEVFVFLFVLSHASHTLCLKPPLDMQVLRKPDGMSRGFGFITFRDEMSVEKCLVIQHTLNGKQVSAYLKCPII